MRTLIFILSITLPFALPAATLSAQLKPTTVNLGNSATLTLRCEGSTPATVNPIYTSNNLALKFLSSGAETRIINGIRTTTGVFTYKVTPKIAGRFAVPAFRAMVNGKNIESDSLTLTVLAEDGNNTPNNLSKGPPTAKLLVKTTDNDKEFYVGEVFSVSMELLALGLRQNHLPVPQLLTPGIRFTRIRPEYQLTRSRAYGGGLYNVYLFQTGAVAMKPGKMNLTFEVDVNVMDYTSDVFGRERKLHLTSDPIALNVLPLPKKGQPKNFTGAVGKFKLTMEARTQNVRTGDPVELTVRLFGRGAIEDTPVPTAANWDGFKVHPATSQINYTDAQHMSSLKEFKQMITPMRPEITHVPPLEFSYFDPTARQYVSLSTSPIKLQVKGSIINQTGPDDPLNTALDNESENEILKLETIRADAGTLAVPKPPLLTQPWFLAIPGLTLLTYLLALGIRKRNDYLDAHPKVARHLRVKRLTQKTLRELQQPKIQSNAPEFISRIQLIIREHIGMAIDQPAEGITAQTLEETELDLSEAARAALSRLLEQDNLTRFANDDGFIDGQSALSDLDLVLCNLK
jgi:hypothetical protein